MRKECHSGRHIDTTFWPKPVADKESGSYTLSEAFLEEAV